MSCLHKIMISTAQTPWLLPSRLNTESRLRLFCFPYAGGGAFIFRDWQAGLSAEIQICPIQLPGRGRRILESSFTRLAPLIEALTTALLPHLDKPFAFFGHSLGAIISFEVARHLHGEYGLKPQHLFVSAHRAPQIPDLDPPTYDLPQTEFIEELKRLNGTPPEILQNNELMRLMIPLLRSDFELVQTYAYAAGPPLDCPISAFGGLRDFEVDREQLKPWHEHTKAAFALRMFPGDHFFIHTARQLLLTAISKDLNQNRPSPSSSTSLTSLNGVQ